MMWPTPLWSQEVKEALESDPALLGAGGVSRPGAAELRRSGAA